MTETGTAPSTEPQKEPPAEPVRYAVDGRLGRATLNRPRAINALDQPTVDSLHAQLTRWADDDAIAAVLLDGAGERGLCAGGDVRVLRDDVLAGRTSAAMRFWQTEYAVNALIADYPKPYLAWMDGVCMGGGVGVSAHGSTRLVTPRTSVAMPETIIGFFPDVGGLWLLAHAPGQLGTHVALTGLPVTSADAVLLGLADALVPSGDLDEVLAWARRLADGEVAETDLPDAWQTAPPAPLAAQRGWIDECYAGDDPAAIVIALREHHEPAAREAARAIEARSPHSVAITLEALRRAADLDVHGVLAQDAVLTRAFVHHPDFVEGVRALLVDKDRSLVWADRDLTQVSRADVLAAFA